MRTRIFFIIMLVFIASVCTNAQSLLRQPTDPNETCQKVWQDYKKADVLWKTGWGLFGTGAGMTVAGCVAWTSTKYSWDGSVWTNPAFSIMLIGCATFVVSIPCLAVGQVRRQSAMKIYDDYNCLPATCEEIKINYKKATTLWKTGWGLFGVGAGLTIGGFLAWRFTGQGGVPPEEQNPKATAKHTAGFTVMIIGAGATVASIPCLSVGQTRRKAAESAYRRKCSSEPPLTFSLQSSANGLGIAMNF